MKHNEAPLTLLVHSPFGQSFPEGDNRVSKDTEKPLLQTILSPDLEVFY